MDADRPRKSQRLTVSQATRLPVVSLLAIACGSQAARPPAGDASQDSLEGAPADTQGSAEAPHLADGDGPDRVESGMGPFPPGPYGPNVGETFPNVEASGYLRLETSGLSSAAPYRKWKVSELRDRSKARYLLMHLGGYL